ncbi:hypothetical protein [Brevibacillus marinus]|nr:hypothetical protein [Brevibacillus marinus]
MNWFYGALALLLFVAGFYFLFKDSVGFRRKKRSEDENDGQ